MTRDVQTSSQGTEGSAGPEGGRVAPTRRTEGSPAAKRGGAGAARRCPPGGTGGGGSFVYVGVGVVCTLAILGTLWWVGRQEADSVGTKLDEFLALGLNEMGDAIAGLAATIALLWLIVTAFMQRAELRDQRKQLELATYESERMAEALEAQADVFRDEQRQRRHYRNNQTLRRKARRLVRLLFDLNSCNNLADFKSSFGGSSMLRIYSIGGAYSAKLSFEEIEDHLLEFAKSLITAIEKLDMKFDRGAAVYQQLDRGFVYGEIQSVLRDLLKLKKDGLSPADAEWLRELRIEDAELALSRLFKVHELWKDELI